MAVAIKRKLSGSTNGRGIKVAATTTPGTTIHTAVTGTTDGTYDEIWLWAQNNHATNDILLTIEFGDDNTEDNIIVTVPVRSGLFFVVPGLVLQNSLVVSAFASAANVITIHGFVNRMTD